MKLLKSIILCAVIVVVSACTDEKHPNPVVRENGYAWIPIADTAFLIPEKTWLKSFGRRKSDGLVDSFIVHATAPDIEPWSEVVNAQMYPPRGPGKRVDIFVKDEHEVLKSQYKSFFQPPQSRWGRPLVEVESEIARSGLRKFIDPGWTGTVFYEKIEKNRVKYFIYCNENENSPDRQHCHLSYPWNESIYIDLLFTRNHLPNSIQMAEKITKKLKDFEHAGLARQPHNRRSGD